MSAPFENIALTCLTIFSSFPEVTFMFAPVRAMTSQRDCPIPLEYPRCGNSGSYPDLLRELKNFVGNLVDTNPRSDIRLTIGYSTRLLNRQHVSLRNEAFRTCIENSVPQSARFNDHDLKVELQL